MSLHVLPDLPEGFTAVFQEEGRFVLRGQATGGPELGFVSLDFDWRRWELGYNGAGFMRLSPDIALKNGYTGRGWKEDLVRDAIQALRQEAARAEEAQP